MKKIERREFFKSFKYTLDKEVIPFLSLVNKIQEGVNNNNFTCIDDIKRIFDNYGR